MLFAARLILRQNEGHEHRRSCVETVELCRTGEWMGAVNTLYADDIVSVKPRAMGEMPAEMHGLEAVRGKTEWFLDAHEVHGSKVSNPFVARDTFVVQFEIDVTNKASNERMQMSEVGIYTVKNGKVVREEFLPQAKSEG